MSSGPMGAGNGAGVGGVPDMHIRHDTHEYGQQHYYNRHNQPQESRHHHRHQRGHQPSAGALPPPTGTSTEPAPNCTITTAVPVKLSSVLPPLSGQCLCGDFTIVISNPRPGMILCHCSHCQINSASFFGTYITAESRNNMVIISSQNRNPNIKPSLPSPKMKVYDAQPEESPNRCPRTFCRRCGTMLFAEPSSIGVLVVNCGLFQNHRFHPALKPQLEIFTSRRTTWLNRREDALQAELMPVFPAEKTGDEGDEGKVTGGAEEYRFETKEIVARDRNLGSGGGRQSGKDNQAINPTVKSTNPTTTTSGPAPSINQSQDNHDRRSHTRSRARSREHRHNYLRTESMGSTETSATIKAEERRLDVMRDQLKNVSLQDDDDEGDNIVIRAGDEIDLGVSGDDVDGDVEDAGDDGDETGLEEIPVGQYYRPPAVTAPSHEGNASDNYHDREKLNTVKIYPTNTANPNLHTYKRAIPSLPKEIPKRGSPRSPQSPPPRSPRSPQSPPPRSPYTLTFNHPLTNPPGLTYGELEEAWKEVGYAARRKAEAEGIVGEGGVILGVGGVEIGQGKGCGEG